ncbi:hypothetical protein E4634_10150 [Mangrovimicrobium sediminis]|uniref:DUF3325 domain-containing protein n=1 Tax=Mangrovimicrobium sediminis TaxID=2562682 RepID=A0A4Z0M1S0_9GAMM|nr:hypothetical protein [Haliea sp. SAOS-164]TGD73386.1 hypothetical protein E4634_10150 [Haliea sp. SAOS-164]
MSLESGWVSAVLLIAGAACLYMASPHQRFAPRRPLAPRVLGAAGLACLLLALWSLLAQFGGATAVFIAVAALMLLWTLSPLACAALRPRSGAQDNKVVRR